MDKELEILKNLSKYLQLKIDSGEHKIIYNDLMQDEKTIDCINAIETLIQALENSIATSVVEEKIDKLEKQKQEKEKILEEVNNVIQKQQSTESELDGAYQYYDETYDEKEKIIYQLQILQELLQRKE